ncbi:MAG: FeoB-associated Cys-rich membrane protein [Oscillospiraceae bacterium]|nr:FeoB-associated Cys-rich membrane protein [Oscillospiraceae bacterium]
MSTVIISLVVALLLFLAGRKLWKDKRAGKSLCGGKCSGCQNCCNCHKGHAK